MISPFSVRLHHVKLTTDGGGYDDSLWLSRGRREFERQLPLPRARQIWHLKVTKVRDTVFEI